MPVERLTNMTVSSGPFVNENYHTPQEVGFYLDYGPWMVAMCKEKREISMHS